MKTIKNLLALALTVAMLMPYTASFAALFNQKAQQPEQKSLGSTAKVSYTGDYVLVYNPTDRQLKTGTVDVYDTGYEGYVYPKGINDVVPETDIVFNVDVADTAQFAVGKIHSFPVYDMAPPYSCIGNYPVAMRCVAEGNHCFLWLPVDAEYTPENCVIDDDMKREITARYDADYEVLRTVYGDIPNLDGTGKTHILLYDIADTSNDPSVSLYDVTGYVSASEVVGGMAIIHMDVENLFADKEWTLAAMMHETHHVLMLDRLQGKDSGFATELLAQSCLRMCEGDFIVDKNIDKWNDKDFSAKFHSGYDIMSSYGFRMFMCEYLRAHTGGSYQIFADILDCIEEYQSDNGPEADYSVSTGAICKALEGADLEGISFEQLLLNVRLAMIADEDSGIYSFNGDTIFDRIENYAVNCPKDITQNGAVVYKTVDGTYDVPEDADDGLVYVGIKDGKVVREPSAITILPETGARRVGVDATLKFNAYVFPNDGQTGVVWSIENPGLASVDKNGVVKGISAGITKLTAQTVTGIKTTVSLTVIKEFSVTSEGVLEHYMGDGGNAVIPDTVKVIRGGAFNDKPVTNVVVPASVETINDNAFYKCNRVESIKFLGNAPKFDSDKWCLDSADDFTIYVYKRSNGFDISELDAYEVVQLCTVTFLGQGNEVIDKVDCRVGAAAVAPEPPQVDGYTFVGWNSDFSRVTYDINVYAKYVKNRYSVVFKDYDGTVLKTESVSHGDHATAPNVPTRQHYSFTGWDLDFSEVKADMTVTATYEPEKYTVVFADDKGAIIETQTVTYLEAAQAPDVHRPGYTTVWDRTFDCIVESITVRASFIHTHHVVTFLDYDNSVYAKVEVPFGGTLTLPEPPVREGYTFVKWIGIPDRISGDIYVTAEYRANVYAITINPANGGDTWHITAKHGETIEKLPDPSFGDKKFLGWYDGYVYFDFSKPVTRAMTLTAKFDSDERVINTVEELLNITNDLTANYRLNCDLDLSGKTISAIGCIDGEMHPFIGTFNGDGHTITNLKCTMAGDACVGLFAHNLGSISNLIVDVNDGSVMGYKNVGVIAGENGGLINNCHVSGGEVSISNRGILSVNVGGIVGQNDETGKITCCSVKDIIITGYDTVGGIAGMNSGEIGECYTTMGINTTFMGGVLGDCIGGLAGVNAGRIYDCNVRPEAPIMGKEHIGGFAGHVTAAGIIERCFVLATGTVVFHNTYSTMTVGTAEEGATFKDNYAVTYKKDCIGAECVNIKAFRECTSINNWSDKVWHFGDNTDLPDLLNNSVMGYDYYHLYTVKFFDYDGKLLNTQHVWTGDDAVAPSAPQREGYTFTGWSGSYTDITCDTELYATYVEGDNTMGDVNNDGEVNTGDAVMILRYTVETATLDTESLRRSDFNGDGSITTGDATALLKYLVDHA